MTWDAFKKEVDKQIKEKGLEKADLDWVDWSQGSHYGVLEVRGDVKDGICIS